MSDSEAGRPSDATISRTLRDVVIAIHKTGNTDDLTVKRVRTRAEQELGLDEGFLKSNQEWKQRSHGLIHEAVEKYCRHEPAPEPKRTAPKPKPPHKKNKPASDSPRGAKRKNPAPAKKPQKRRKTVSSDEESDAAPPKRDKTPSNVDSKPPKKIVRRPRKVVTEDSEDSEHTSVGKPDLKREEGDDEEDKPGKDPEPEARADIKGVVSESEMSSLEDDSPVKKKRQKQSPSEKRAKEPRVQQATKPRARTSKGQDDDPDQAEIKRLQGWLVKCGIRKVWSKELAKYDTAKEKIKHLKNMLKDAGMEGKYSVEKAAGIKEQREFAKDLEAIQEGELRWGKVGRPAESGRPQRAAVRATKSVGIQDSVDDEDESAEAPEKNDESDDADSDEEARRKDDSSDDSDNHEDDDEDSD